MGRFVGSIRIRSFGGLKKVSLFTVFAIAVLGFCWAGMAHAADKLLVKNSGGTTTFVVTDAGAVGSGVTEPSYPFDLSSSGVSESCMHFSLNGTDVGGWITSVANNNFFLSSGSVWNSAAGGWIQKSNDGKTVIAGSGSAGYRLLMGQNGTVGNVISPTTELSIDYSGNMTVNSLAGTGNAYACVNSSGTIYRSATPCN